MTDQLQELAATLKEIGAKDFGVQIATAAVPLLEEGMRDALSSGTSPNGKTWVAKKGGGKPYVHAADKVTVKSYGDVIRIAVKGPEAYGHYGARGMPVRQMVPDAGGGIPTMVSDAITKAARKTIDEVTR